MCLHAVLARCLSAEGALLLLLVVALCRLGWGVLDSMLQARAERRRLAASPSARFRAEYAELRRARCVAGYK